VQTTADLVHFSRFILTEIFPGGWLPTIPVVEEHSVRAGFEVTRVQSLQLHYAKTLDIWASALESNRDAAVAIQSQEVYDRYMKYLTGCADLFRRGVTDVCQFTLTK
jgi:cyclopropane-fatty-acyl-phospholipid synthase